MCVDVIKAASRDGALYGRLEELIASNARFAFWICQSTIGHQITCRFAQKRWKRGYEERVCGLELVLSYCSHEERGL